MGVQVLGIVLSTGASTAIGVAGSTIASAYALTYFLTTTAIGLALYALTPKPGAPSQQARGYQTTQFGTALDHQVVYGKARVSGVRIYDEVTGENNKYLHRIIAFCGHEIESFDEVYLDDQVVALDGNRDVTSPSNYTSIQDNSFAVRIKAYTGTPNQTADPDLVSASSKWTTDHRLRGIAYLYIRLRYNPDIFPNGIPEVSATIKGKKVYDPRTDTTAWSDNPALCLRDYLTSDYGLAETSARIDDDLISTAADVCDDVATIDGTTRYTCNGAFVTGTTPYDLLGRMLTSMGGLLWYSQGKWRAKAASWTPAVQSFDENDLVAPITVNTRHARRDNFNSVAGTFRGPETNWQTTDFPAVSNASFIAADGGDERPVDLELPFTDNSIEARRISRIVLERNRQQLSVNCRFNLKGFNIQVGDNIKFSNSRFGWTDKEFEVTSWTFGFNDAFKPFVDVTLREISESVFDEIDDGVVYENDNTDLYNPWDVPTVGISPSISTTVINERVLTVLALDITSSRSEEIDVVEVEYKANAETEYTSVGIGELGLFRVVDIEEGVYDIRARAINALGVKGAWTDLSDYTVSASTVTVNDVTGFNFNLADANIILSWDASTGNALSYYRIRHALEESGASWANATTVVEKVSRPATSISVPARPGTYFIRAFSKTGVQSENSTSVVVPETYLTDFTNTSTQTEETAFSGTDSNTTTVSNELLLLSYATAPSTGEYTFSNYIDTTASRRVRARIDLETRRVDDTAGLFDDLTGNFDSLPGLFDDLTGFNQVDDTDVETYISITNDDPAGTPTWTDYQKFQAGEFYGRAFRFKVKLISDSDDVTPAIDALTARVQYN